MEPKFGLLENVKELKRKFGLENGGKLFHEKTLQTWKFKSDK